MILVINIGNSNLKFGIFTNKNYHCINFWKTKTIKNIKQNKCFIMINNFFFKKKIHISSITDVIIGSVVPNLTSMIEKIIYKIYGKRPIIINKNTKSNIIHDFKEIGTDLYANAAAAIFLYQKTSLIIDFGTSLTLTCVKKNGILLGVIIIPGISISLKTLIQKTSQLKKVQIKKPKYILGVNSETSIQSGITNGYICMIEGLIKKINKEIQEKCFVIITGGMCKTYHKIIDNTSYLSDDKHTIKGLKILYDHMNIKNN